MDLLLRTKSALRGGDCWPAKRYYCCSPPGGLRSVLIAMDEQELFAILCIFGGLHLRPYSYLTAHDPLALALANPSLAPPSLRTDHPFSLPNRKLPLGALSRQIFKVELATEPFLTFSISRILSGNIAHGRSRNGRVCANSRRRRLV